MPNILEPQRWNLKWNVYSLDSASRACDLEREGGNEAALTDVPLRRRRDSASVLCSALAGNRDVSVFPLFDSLRLSLSKDSNGFLYVRTSHSFFCSFLSYIYEVGGFL